MTAKTFVVIAWALEAFSGLAFAQQRVPAAPGDGLRELTSARTPLRRGDRISFFGDSITMQGGFIERLATALAASDDTRDLEVQLFRHGLNGGRVPTVLAGESPWGKLGGTMRSLLEAEAPTIVVVYLGVNDVWHGENGTSLPDYEAGLEQMVGLCREIGATAILCTPSVIGEETQNNAHNETLADYADAVRRLAGAEGLTLCDLHQAFVEILGTVNPDQQHQGHLTYDGVHMNDAGNQLIADQVSLALLEARGAPGGLAAAAGGEALPAATDGGLPRAADEWYLPTEDGRCQLFVREYGEGEPVVVLHGGWGAEHSYLVDAIAPHLGDRRFVLYDQRGSLRSPAPLESVSVDQHVADLEQLRRVLDLDEMPILAHSMGTFLAQSYLERHPERVAELVLTAAVPPVVEGDALETLQSSSVHLTERPEVDAVLAAEGLTGVDLTPRQQTHAWRVRFAAVNLYHVDRWRQLQGGRIFYAGVAGERAGSTMPDRWDFIDALAAHPWNVTVILGDHDFIDWQAAHWLAAAADLPDVNLSILENAGHNAWIDQPAAFAAALAGALER